jgi:hypothetical protein
MVGYVVLSTIGTSFSFGHPSIDDVVNRFLNSVTSGGGASGGASNPKKNDVPMVEKTTEPTIAPHKMESSLALLNRLWRRLVKHIWRVSSFSMRLISPFTIGK